MVLWVVLVVVAVSMVVVGMEEVLVLEYPNLYQVVQFHQFQGHH